MDDIPSLSIASHSSGIKEPSEAETCTKKLAANIVGFLLIVFIFFAGMGFLIQASTIPDSSQSGNNEKKNTKFESDSSCSEHSYLLGDGICDEITNVAKCFFDQGDCCRETKDKQFCIDCSCRVEVDTGLQNKLKERKTVEFNIPRVSEHMFKTVKVVEDIEFADMCAELCLAEKSVVIIGWLVTKDMVCKCLSAPKRICHNLIDKPESNPDHQLYLTLTTVTLISNCQDKILLLPGAIGNDFVNFHGLVINTVPPSQKPFCELSDMAKDFDRRIGFGTVGILYNGLIPFHCGGMDLQTMSGMDGCISLLTEVKMTATMQKIRAKAASIVIGDDQDTMFVAGGTSDSLDLVIHETTEMISPGKESVSGPDIPVPIRSHCFVKIDSDKALLIGGVNRDVEGTDLAFFYSILDQTWTTGPPMPCGKFDHACGLIEDSGNGDHLLVVVGGDHFGTCEWGNVQVLDIVRESWTISECLPMSLIATSQANLVSLSSNELLLIGGVCSQFQRKDSSEPAMQGSNPGKIFSIRCWNGQCHSRANPDIELPEAKAGFSAIMVPEQLVDCPRIAQDNDEKNDTFAPWKEEVYKQDFTCPQDHIFRSSSADCQADINHVCDSDLGGCLASPIESGDICGPPLRELFHFSEAADCEYACQFTSACGSWAFIPYWCKLMRVSNSQPCHGEHWIRGQPLRKNSEKIRETTVILEPGVTTEYNWLNWLSF